MNPPDLAIVPAVPLRLLSFCECGHSDIVHAGVSGKGTRPEARLHCMLCGLRKCPRYREARRA